MNIRMKEAFKLRAQTYADIRTFFQQQGFTEADPPVLARTTIPESTIPAISCRAGYLAGGPAQHKSKTDHSRLTLLPSPERYLKQLIAAGCGPLYSISHAFRNTEARTPHHAIEFTMLEWYLIHADHLHALESCRALMTHLLPGVQDRVMSMDEAFVECAGAQPGTAYSPVALAALLRDNGMDARDDEAEDDLFFRAFLGLVEPHLPSGAVYLVDYPTLIPSLAQPSAEGPWAQRWELYVDGIELANCYREERDTERIRTFMSGEFERMGREPWDIEDIVQDMSSMPPCSGVAMGIDRLLMLRGQYEDIGSVIISDYERR